MDDLDSIKKNAGLNETPMRNLSAEANDQLAADMEEIASEAIALATSLRHRNEKQYKVHWDEFSYLVHRMKSQLSQT